jgi:hypothetical protein
MSKKRVSVVIIVGGVMLLVLSLGADLIGIGSRAGIHWKQLTGAGLGLAASIYGYWQWRSTANDKK